MPRLVDRDLTEAAYVLWKEGSKLPEIAEQLGNLKEIETPVSVMTLEQWRSRYGWVARKRAEETEDQAGKLRKAGNSLFAIAPRIMDAAIDLAFNAESESVRATQQRYLLGSLGISPDTATERIRQLQLMEEKIRKLAEPEIVEVEQAHAVLEEAAKGQKW